jgi:hypothetical protein
VSEQERAEQLAQSLDRLLAGQGVPVGDPLLDLAKRLAEAPLQPSPQALARFEQQLNQWFGVPAPTAPTLRPVPMPLVAAGIAIVVIIVIVVALLVIGPLITPAATSTATASPTATSTSTATATPTITPTAAALTLTPPTFSRVIVTGQIDSIQGNTMVVLGQPIRIEGGPNRLCVGDLIRVEVAIGPDGAYSARRTDVRVETSACQPAPTAPPQPNPGGGGQPGGRDDDD